MAPSTTCRCPCAPLAVARAAASRWSGWTSGGAGASYGDVIAGCLGGRPIGLEPGGRGGFWPIMTQPKAGGASGHSLASAIAMR